MTEAEAIQYVRSYFLSLRPLSALSLAERYYLGQAKRKHEAKTGKPTTLENFYSELCKAAEGSKRNDDPA